MGRAREVLRLLWDTGYRFFEDRCPSMAAALSFYTFFSLPPLLVLLLLLVGTLVDPTDVGSAILAQIRELVGREGANQVQVILRQAQEPDAGRPAATALGALALAFGATTAFAELQAALNRTWGVEPDPDRGTIRIFVVKRIFSFGLLLVVAFLLLVSLVLSTILVSFGDTLTGSVPGQLSGPLLEAANVLLSLLVVTLLFAAMYRVIPDAEIAWRDVWIGAIATSLLFVAGKLLLGLYLGSSEVGEAYGAAGSLAVILLWVYYSSMILLFGAELTRSWAQRYGRGVVPSEGAVEVVEERRHIRH